MSLHWLMMVRNLIRNSVNMALVYMCVCACVCVCVCVCVWYNTYSVGMQALIRILCIFKMINLPKQYIYMLYTHVLVNNDSMEHAVTYMTVWLFRRLSIGRNDCFRVFKRNDVNFNIVFPVLE